MHNLDRQAIYKLLYNLSDVASLKTFPSSSFAKRLKFYIIEKFKNVLFYPIPIFSRTADSMYFN